LSSIKLQCISSVSCLVEKLFFGCFDFELLRNWKMLLASNLIPWLYVYYLDCRDSVTLVYI
jgi:hypothetical protein